MNESRGVERYHQPALPSKVDLVSVGELEDVLAPPAPPSELGGRNETEDLPPLSP
jgi:hypothetical protein